VCVCVCVCTRARARVCCKLDIQQQPPFYGHYTGQPALVGTYS